MLLVGSLDLQNRLPDNLYSVLVETLNPAQSISRIP